MSFEREKLFNLIKQKLPSNISFTGEIADVLDISYDAAYRRLSGKATLSFEEALSLSRYFKISLNSIHCFNEDKISALKQSSINSKDELADFFMNMTKTISLFIKYRDAEFLYAVKDIPLYYIPSNTLYAKFRLYFFYNIYSNKKLTSFKKFSLTSDLIYDSKCFKNSFRKLNGIEIWNDTTINSSLYKIYYFYNIKMISKEEAIQLCVELKKLIENIEIQAINEVWGEVSNLKYQMYYNKLINLNNTIFLKSKSAETILVPYTSMSYLSVDDDKTCKEIGQYFKKQLKFSKKISGDAEIDRQLFFASMYGKIDQLKKQIEVKSGISFM